MVHLIRHVMPSTTSSLTPAADLRFAIYFNDCCRDNQFRSVEEEEDNIIYEGCTARYVTGGDTEIVDVRPLEVAPVNEHGVAFPSITAMLSRCVWRPRSDFAVRGDVDLGAGVDRGGSCWI